MSGDLKQLGLIGLLVLLAASLAVARPADLTDDELEVLEEDLQDIEDARAVDEAYERLYGGGAPRQTKDPVHAAPAAPREVAKDPLFGDDYDGELPQGDQPMPDGDEETPASPTLAVDAVVPTTYKLADLIARVPNEAFSKDLNLTLAAFNARLKSIPPASEHRDVEASGEESEAGQPGPAPGSMRARDKENRLNAIKDYIITVLNRTSGPLLPPPHHPANTDQWSIVFDRINLTHGPSQDVFAENLRSQYPSCSLPRNTDEELWSSPHSMNLLFEVSGAAPAAGRTANLMQATLHLYKVSNDNVSLPPSPSCGGPSMMSPTLAGSLAGSADDALPLQALLSPVEERKLRVSVFWYTRSLKKNRVKRKLVDSRMVSRFGSQWTEWDVKPAVKVWRESGRNFGLVIEVEDEDGNMLPARDFFIGRNCTQEAFAATSGPLPSIIHKVAREYHHGHADDGSDASDTLAHALNRNLYPMIDLYTVDTADDGDGRSAAYSPAYHLPNSVKHLMEQKPQAAHKHRHRHRADQGHDADLVPDLVPDVPEPTARRLPRGGKDDGGVVRKIIISREDLQKANLFARRFDGLHPR